MSEGNNNIEYRIKTTADVKGLQEVAKGFEEQIKLAKESGRSAAIFERELTKVNAALNTQKGLLGAQAAALEKSIATMGKSGMNVSGLLGERNALLKEAGMQTPSAAGTAFGAFRDAGGGMGGLRAAAGTFGAGAAAGVAVVAGAVALGAKSLNEFADAEERVAKLDAALAQRGQLTADYREKLQDLAGTLQELTGIADDEWIGVMTKLTQMGANPGDIDQSVDAVKNLAGLLGGDLTTAAMMVGKALQGEFTAFSRLGIQLDDHASKVENVKTLYRELALRGGGQLEGALDTINGSFRQVKNGVADTAEAIGSLIATAFPIKEFMAGAGTLMSKLAGKIEGTIGASKNLKNASKETAEAMQADARKTAEEYEKLKQRVNDTKDAVSNYIAKQQEAAGQKKTELDAKYERDVAKVDAQEKRGWITPLQAEMQRSRLKETLETGKNGIENKTRDDVMKHVNEQFMQAQRDQADKDREAAEANAKVDAANATSERRGKVGDQFKASIDAAKKEWDAAPYQGEVWMGAGSDFAGGGARTKSVINARAEKERAYKAALAKQEAALKDFDKANPSQNVDALKEEAKKKAEAAEKWKAENSQYVFGLVRQADSLVGEKASAERVQGFQAETRRTARGEALQEARQKEIGEVRQLPGGGMEGSPEAIRQAQQIQRGQEQVRAATAGPNGDQRFQSILRQKEAELANLSRILDAVLMLSNGSRQSEAKVRQIEDQIRIMKSQMANGAFR